MHVISALRMKPFVLDNWRRLPLPGKLIGDIGQPTLHLWDSIQTYNQQPLNNKFSASQDSPSAFAQDTMDEDDRYRLQQLQAQLLPLGRRLSLAIGHNPAKVIGSDKFLPALQVMINGFAKEDPPTRKMLPPVESDVPELLVEMGYSKSGTAHT